MRKYILVIATAIATATASVSASGVRLQFPVSNDVEVDRPRLFGLGEGTVDLWVTSADGERKVRVRCVKDGITEVQAFSRTADGSANVLDGLGKKDSYQKERRECEMQIAELQGLLVGFHTSVISLDLDSGAVTIEAD